MRSRERSDHAAKLRADGYTTSQIVQRWIVEGLNPREAARLAHGWTQQQAADEYNELFPDADNPCTRKTISGWETARSPSLVALNRLARLYRVRAGDLVDGEDWSHLDGPGRPGGAVALAVAVAVVVHQGRVLLVKPHGGGWQFPSGVVKPDQDAESRAEEECAAETGVRCVATLHLGGRVHPKSAAWCDYFAADYLAGEVNNGQPNENADVMWAPLSSLGRFIASNRIYDRVLTYLERA